MSLKIIAATVALLVLTGCASTPEPVAGTKEAALPSPKACKARDLVFTKDANGKGYCVTEAQARCQQSALLVLGDADCLNTLMWKDNTSRPEPLSHGTAVTPTKN